ncbi:hypothetical protein FACS1894208_07450 [Clostridia bacterium]|nr:hypothetical protein FACS1894208_07450 [Clostridia bacterium]
MRFKLHTRGKLRRVLTAVNLGVKALNPLPQLVDCVLILLVVIRLALEHEHFARFKVKQVEALRDFSRIIGGDFRALGVQACLGQPQAYRFIQRLFDCAENVPRRGNTVLAAPDFPAVIEIIIRVFAAAQQEFPRGALDDLREDYSGFFVHIVFLRLFLRENAVRNQPAAVRLRGREPFRRNAERPCERPRKTLVTVEHVIERNIKHAGFLAAQGVRRFKQAFAANVLERREPRRFLEHPRRVELRISRRPRDVRRRYPVADMLGDVRLYAFGRAVFHIVSHL